MLHSSSSRNTNYILYYHRGGQWDLAQQPRPCLNSKFEAICLKKGMARGYDRLRKRQGECHNGILAPENERLVTH